MIRITILIAALVAGLILGPMAAGNKGYVLIAAGDYTIEASLTSALIMAGCFYLLLLAVEWLLKRGFALGGNTRNWWFGRRSKRARKQTEAGMLALAEGNYKHAEKLVAKAAKASDTPTLNYLAAAEAAQEQGNTGRRNDYLKLASKGANQGSLAVTITQASLQIRQGEYEQALATLEKLSGQASKHGKVLLLQKQVYEHLGEWQKLLDLLPRLQKQGLIGEEQLAASQRQALFALLEQIAEQEGSEGLLQRWNQLPRKDKQIDGLVAQLCRLLIAKEDSDSAYQLLFEQLKKHPDSASLRLLAQLKLNDYHPLIVFLQDLLKRDPDNPELHGALGELLAREQQWTEAQQALQRSVELAPNQHNCLALAQVLEHQHEQQQAFQYYRQGLQLSAPPGS